MFLTSSYIHSTKIARKLIGIITYTCSYTACLLEAHQLISDADASFLQQSVSPADVSVHSCSSFDRASERLSRRLIRHLRRYAWTSVPRIVPAPLQRTESAGRHRSLGVVSLTPSSVIITSCSTHNAPSHRRDRLQPSP